MIPDKNRGPSLVMDFTYSGWIYTLDVIDYYISRFLFPFPQNERYLLLAIDLKKDKGVKVTTYCFEIHDLLTETVVKTVKVTNGDFS